VKIKLPGEGTDKEFTSTKIAQRERKTVRGKNIQFEDKS